MTCGLCFVCGCHSERYNLRQCKTGKSTQQQQWKGYKFHLWLSQELKSKSTFWLILFSFKKWTIIRLKICISRKKSSKVFDTRTSVKRFHLNLILNYMYNTFMWWSLWCTCLKDTHFAREILFLWTTWGDFEGHVVEHKKASLTNKTKHAKFIFSYIPGTP